MKKQEENIQLAICKYLRLAYPNAIFMCDLASGIKMSIGAAVKAKKMRSSRGLPDLFIAEPSADGFWHGLFLELKRDEFKMYKKNGDYVNEHLAEQAGVLRQLQKRRYYAEFAIGFEQAKLMIDYYFGKYKRPFGKGNTVKIG